MMSPTETIAKEVQNPQVRSFLRSLNILLKNAQMYGVGHVQTASQISDAWKTLQAALAGQSKSGLQFAASEGRLLVNGAPLKAGPAEQSFAQLLSQADVSSVTFLPEVTSEAFNEVVRIFASRGPKSENLAEQLKAAFGDESKGGVRVNEVRFVPAGSGGKETSVAAELLAQTLGTDARQVHEMLDDPQRLLQMITAIEDSNPGGRTGAGAGPGTGPGSGAGGGADGGSGTGTGSGAGGASEGGPGGAASPGEAETTAVIRLLAELAGKSGGGKFDPAELQSRISSLPKSSQEILQQALAEFAKSDKNHAGGAQMLQKVAEHMAVRLAIERYKRGDSKVDAVTEMLNRMNREIESLRATVGTYEEKHKDSGSTPAGPAASLEQEFWAGTPEEAKLDVLLSDQAWRVPARVIRQHFEQLLKRKESDLLERIWSKYAGSIQSPNAQIRRRIAQGMRELGQDFPQWVEGFPYRIAIQNLGEQLRKEDDAELQKTLAATFVLFSQEAATRQRYSAVLDSLSAIEALQPSHAELAHSLRARIGLDHRISDFLEEAVRTTDVPPELTELLRRMSVIAAEQIASRLSRCGRRRERDRLVKLAFALDRQAARLLREAFQSRTPAAAVHTVGFLSMIQPEGLDALLRVRLAEWNRFYHEAVVRQIAATGIPGRGVLLAALLDALDPLVLPMALDEIGVSGDAAAATLLVRIVQGELPKIATPYLRVKAIEALGRLRAKQAFSPLRQLVEGKDRRQSAAERELAIVAAQSLRKIDAEAAKPILSAAGISAADLEPIPYDHTQEAPGVRQRYYPRTKLPSDLAARIAATEGEFAASLHELSMGGGLFSCEKRIAPETPATIRIKSGLRGFTAKIVLRDARSDRLAFDIVDLALEDRAKLRAFLAGIRK